MNRSEFRKFMDSQYEIILGLDKTKGNDYAGDEDALANFKEEAEELGLTPVQVWGVYTSKHWKAIRTFIRKGAVKSEPIEGRLHDMILYSFLMLALRAEQEESND